MKTQPTAREEARAAIIDLMAFGLSVGDIAFLHGATVEVIREMLHETEEP